jgi:uncharacterized protein (TIGR03086 family)
VTASLLGDRRFIPTTKGHPMEPTEQLAAILPTIIDIVDRIEADQLGDPTPCANFDVQGVLDHMIGGVSTFVPAFLGESAVDSPGTGVVPSTQPGDVPAAEFAAVMTGLLVAVNAPGAMDRMIDAPFGTVPGSVFARFIAFDGLIHGWDLATATGQAYSLPDEVVADVFAFAREAVGPDMRDGDTFAAEVLAPAGADQLSALVAFSGRELAPTVKARS